MKGHTLAQSALRSAAVGYVFGLGLLLTAQSGFAAPAPSVSADASTTAGDCQVPAEQGGLTFPIHRLDAPSRCLIGSVINGYTTSGTMGPVYTPVTRGLYDYLLDRPIVTASLLQALGMATYHFSKKGSTQYWVNDGDGTQGLLTLLYHDETSRIYHIDGFHEGRIFPMVRAKAVVFLNVKTSTTPEGSPAVAASLVSYTRLHDPILAGLVRILRGLVGDTVNRKLARGFELTNQLSQRIASEPDRIIQQIGSLPSVDAQDGRALKSLLQSTLPLSSPLRLHSAPVAP